MAIGFGTVAFSVALGDAELPLPVPGEYGIETYTATVRLASGSALSNLKGLLSLVTIAPALGMVGGGSAIVEAGAGQRTLTYPSGGNDEIAHPAILTSITPRGYLTTDDVWLADCVFTLSEEPA